MQGAISYTLGICRGNVVQAATSQCQPTCARGARPEETQQTVHLPFCQWHVRGHLHTATRTIQVAQLAHCAAQSWCSDAALIAPCGQRAAVADLPNLTPSMPMYTQVLNCSSWPVILYRAWKLYLLGTSVAGATRAGVVGLRAGFGMGRSLVQEQTSMLLQLLSAMAGVVGTPYAELIWFQAVACLAFGLLSEMVYTSILGLVVGTVFGFARGYLNAIKATLAVAGGSASRAVLAARGAAKLATSAPAHVLRALAAAAKYLPTCFFH